MLKSSRDQLQEIEEAIKSYDPGNSEILKKVNKRRKKTKKQVRTFPKISKYKVWYKSKDKLANSFSRIYATIISKLLDILIR